MNKKTIMDWKTEFEKLLNDEYNEKFFSNPNNLAFSYSRRKAAIPELLEVTRFIDDNNLYMGHKKQPTAPMSLRVYCILNDIHDMESYPKCPMCGKGRSFDSITKGFKMTCGKRTCFQSHPETNKKRQSTAKQNYGDLKSAYYDTSRKTVKERYGTDNISKLEEIKQKKIETSRKNYGTDYPWQSDEGKRLQRLGMVNKYGVDNVSQSLLIKRVKEETCLRNWGYRNPFQVPKIKEMIIEKHREVYNDYKITNISQLMDIQNKKLIKTSKEYISPDGKSLKYQGNEDIALDYIFNHYKNIYTQPSVRIPYMDGYKNIHFWFPDALIEFGNDKIISEFKELSMMQSWVTGSELTKYKLIGGFVADYIPHLYISNKKLDELYLVEFLCSDKNESWLVHSLKSQSSGIKDVIETLTNIGFENINLRQNHLQ